MTINKTQQEGEECCGCSHEVSDVCKGECMCHHTTTPAIEENVKTLKRYLVEAYPDPRPEHVLCGLLDEILDTLTTKHQEEVEKVVDEVRADEAEQIAVSVRFYLERDDLKRALEYVNRFISKD